MQGVDSPDCLPNSPLSNRSVDSLSLSPSIMAYSSHLVKACSSNLIVACSTTRGIMLLENTVA